MGQFSGVNDAVLKQAVLFKKMEIESKLRETSRFQECETKKVTPHSYISSMMNSFHQNFLSFFKNL